MQDSFQSLRIGDVNGRGGSWGRTAGFCRKLNGIFETSAAPWTDVNGEAVRVRRENKLAENNGSKLTGNVGLDLRVVDKRVECLLEVLAESGLSNSNRVNSGGDGITSYNLGESLLVSSEVWFGWMHVGKEVVGVTVYPTTRLLFCVPVFNCGEESYHFTLSAQ